MVHSFKVAHGMSYDISIWPGTRHDAYQTLSLTFPIFNPYHEGPK